MMVFTIDNAKDTAKDTVKDIAKARLLDEYMRTGDLAALVKAYTDLKANAEKANADKAKASSKGSDINYENTGYNYFDVTF
jgi:hypothetical protein